MNGTVEFSLARLAGLLAEHGFRVVEGLDTICSTSELTAGGHTKSVDRLEIELHVIQEKPESNGGSPPAPVKFSIAGLAGVLEEHGFRVLGGYEEIVPDRELTTDDHRKNSSRMEIELRVIREKPKADDDNPFTSEGRD
jgi:hypothetical protein